MTRRFGMLQYAAMSSLTVPLLLLLQCCAFATHAQLQDVAGKHLLIASGSNGHLGLISLWCSLWF